MKRKIGYIYIVISLCLLISCRGNVSKSLIDGDDYKFWLNVDDYGWCHISYFGSDGKFKYFSIYHGIKDYNDDAQPYHGRKLSKKWYLRNDSIMYYSHMWKIEELTEKLMILSKGAERDTMFVAPKGMIPKHLDHKW